MRKIFSERNIVVILFVLVLITFSLAQEESKKMEKIYPVVNAVTASHLLVHQPVIKVQGKAASGLSSSPAE